jgi:hypothetical protein
MNLKDQITVGNWLHGRYNLAAVNELERHGLVGNERFSERAREVYIFLWS